MRCQACGFENASGIKFCGECGAPLKLRCSSCGFENVPGIKFCGECGAALGGTTAVKGSDAGSVAAFPDGERRHLTVLFCDLAGSTEIAARLDPEDWRETVASYQRAAAEAIARYGGHVAKYLGDGVMAFFGYPEAHDNDAERGARAGLDLLEAIAKLNQHATHPKLSARVGIDSGAVVVGAGVGKEADVFGDAPNIAARVQGAAEPDTVLITDSTHRLVSGLFVVEDRGAAALKGIERPVRLYRVIQPSGVRGRLEAAAASHGLTPFVGREDELHLLMKRWERALEGEGQVVVIIGEAGIGKSRLVQRFHEEIAGIPHTWVEASAAPFFQNTPFYLVVEILRELLAWRADQPSSDRLAQLESRLEVAGLKPAEAVPLIAPLLNLPLPAKYPPSPLTPEQQRRRLMATLAEWMLGTTRMQPLIVATQDLHWADPSTLELIQILVEQGATARLLLLYTARPDFRVEWPLRAHHTQINLNRLNVRDIRTMVREVAARKALSDETIATVVERTGGVPLFIEELTRAVLESGDVRLPKRAIPATLRDSLMARLDRLGPAKEVLQLGAVIDGEFSYELLHAVHPFGEADLQHALQRLADAELLYVRGIAPHASYQFKHALIRDAAYGALLRSRRKELHRLVAHTLSEKFPELKETNPEVLARHWTEAGETERAIAEWSRAGTAAHARHAFREALDSYQRAVVLLGLLPESRERDLCELRIRQSLLKMLHLTKGYSAPETIDATKRAAALAEKSGNLRELLNLMIATGVNALSSGDLPAAGANADQALELALREGSSSSLLGRVHALQMLVRYCRGDLAGVERHFAAGCKFVEEPGFRRTPAGAAVIFGTASWNAWTLGRAAVAREREDQMMAAANRNDPYEMAFLSHFVAQLRVWTREYEQAEQWAVRALELSEEHQFLWLAALSRSVLGQARAELGRATEGITLIRQGMASLLEIGSRYSITNIAGSLAEAQQRDGATTDALEAFEQARQANPDELVYQPEILRLRGQSRLKLGDPELAEADFREAIALAQKMDAKAWELRATTSLARLLGSQGRRDEAHAMLGEIYGWFTEGFDTADLMDAKALLDALS